MSIDTLLSRLDGVRARGAGRWSAKCPAHEDRHASLSVRELDDGRVLVHDFTGCTVQEVLAAVGLTFDALYPPRERTDHRARRERRPFFAGDVLRALAHEASVLWIIACDVRAAKQLSDADHARLALAVERINNAVEYCAHA